LFDIPYFFSEEQAFFLKHHPTEPAPHHVAQQFAKEHGNGYG
jgi:hypothetical protein